MWCRTWWTPICTWTIYKYHHSTWIKQVKGTHEVKDTSTLCYCDFFVFGISERRWNGWVWYKIRFGLTGRVNPMWSGSSRISVAAGQHHILLNGINYYNRKKQFGQRRVWDNLHNNTVRQSDNASPRQLGQHKPELSTPAMLTIYQNPWVHSGISSLWQQQIPVKYQLYLLFAWDCRNCKW